MLTLAGSGATTARCVRRLAGSRQAERRVHSRVEHAEQGSEREVAAEEGHDVAGAVAPACVSRVSEVVGLSHP